MSAYVHADNKALAVAQMYALGGALPEPLGPGSKEKKSALQALGRAIGLELEVVPGKNECGRLIAEAVNVAWDEACYSAGDTITLQGMNRLLDGVVTWKISTGSVLEEAILDMLSQVDPVHLTPIGHEEQESVTADAETTEQDIADRVARLSQSKTPPDGVSGSRASLESIDVGIADGTWRECLSEVQGWLRFSDDIDDSSAEAFDASLRRLLDLAPDSSFEVLLVALAERLEQAVALCERFEPSLASLDEGGATITSATQDWIAAWEELTEEADSESSGPIKAHAKTWPIMQFRQHAEDGDLELSPSYQRADVWPTRDAQQLIESVLRGIPLPSVILLQLDSESRTRYEVVDGKQRLTSILRFIARHPIALEIVEQKAREWNEPDLISIFQSDYPQFRKMWKKHESETLTTQVERTMYFPFALRSGEVKPLSGELEAFRGKYYSQIRQQPVTVVGNKKTVQSIFEQVSNYEVPVLVYEQVTSKQIHEVFSLYNKQGKHLNAEEIRNALYHELDFMRALLVTAGDSDDIGIVAPFLMEEWHDLESTAGVLDEYGFAKAGFKRTKLLSWVAATLLYEDGRPDARSTANQINGLLRRVKDDRGDPLRNQTTILSSMLLLDHAIDAHAVIPVEVWAPSFKVAKAGRWQELQLVATLVALGAARMVHGEDLEDVVEAKLNVIADRSRSDKWKRPQKTQSKVQWTYTATVAGELMAILEVDPAAADYSLRGMYGHSGLGALLDLARID